MSFCSGLIGSFLIRLCANIIAFKSIKAFKGGYLIGDDRMSIIKGNIFTVFITVVLKIGGFWRNNTFINAVLNTNFLIRDKIGKIIDYFNITITTVEA